jgi:hypothetical protein
MPESGCGQKPPIGSGRDAPVVLAPRHLVCVLVPIPPADSMMLADLGATQPGKVGFGLIGVHAIVSHVFLTVVDPPRVIGRVLLTPSSPRLRLLLEASLNPLGKFSPS